MPNTYELKVTYTQGRELASWDFDRKGAEKCCNVYEGDHVNVTFDGPGDIGEAIMLCGQMENGKPSSPFTAGNNINLKTSSTLTAGQLAGKWGFTIAFTARNADATTSFYYVPDPEIIVSPNPGSDDVA